MLPAVIRTSSPAHFVIFRLRKCSSSTRTNKSLPLTPFIAGLESQGYRSSSAERKLFAFSEIQKALQRGSLVVFFVYNIKKV